MEKKPKILILTVKWGHYSIAKGVQNALSENGYKSKLVKVKVEKFSDYSYALAYRYFPKVWKAPFILSGDKRASKIILGYLHQVYKKKISKIIEKEDPDVVVNTYFAFNPTLEELQEKTPFVFINVVENPPPFSRIEVNKSAYNICFGKAGVAKCRSFGLDTTKCVKGGWFVRKSFYEAHDKVKMRKKLGLKTKGLVFCIVGGSEGSYNSLKALPAFTNCQKPVQAVFICGNNRALLNGVKGFKNLIASQNHSSADIIPLGFTKNIDEYIKASDIVVGKAGPNLLFETVATRTPFFAIAHIAGQEDGNLEIVKKYKLGFVEENTYRSIKLIRKIIDNPKILEKFQKPLEKLSDYNQSSGKTLVNLIEENFT